MPNDSFNYYVKTESVLPLKYDDPDDLSESQTATLLHNILLIGLALLSISGLIAIAVVVS